MPEPPESLICFLSFGLFHTKLIWVRSFPQQTNVTFGHSLHHPHRLIFGWPGGDLSSVASLMSAVQRREWGIACACGHSCACDHSKGILGQRGTGLGLPFLWYTGARDMVAQRPGKVCASQSLCSLSLSSWGRFPRPLIIFVSLLWTLSSPVHIFLYSRDQN